jgi:DNA-binding transcriptional LysR family regulator
MRLDRFDLNLLIVLDALLDERNVTRASERLHIGQPATSGALARLREYFGDELLVPVGRRLELTPLARGLVKPVRDALLMTRSALALKPGFDPLSASRRFTLYASDYVFTVLLADLACRLADAAPGLALDVRTPPMDVLDVFERGSVDLLILPEPYLTPLQGPRQSLFADTQVCMVWRGHNLTGDAISMDEYMQAGHVALRMGDRLSVAFEDWFLPRSGSSRRIEASVDHFSAIPLLLRGTQRVATLHRRLAEYFVALHPVRILEPPFEIASSCETMAWPVHLDRDPAHLWLRHQLKEAAFALASTTPRR